MKTTTSLSRLLLPLALGASLLAGCASAPLAGPGTSASPVGSSTVEVADLQGTPVSVPAPADLDSIVVTSFKGAYGSAVLLGQIDKITGMADNSKFTWLRHAFPQAAQVKDYGSFDKVNIEELMQDAPDAIISPSTASTANEKMRSLELPVLVDGIDIEDHSDVFRQSYDEIDLVARLTGTEARAKEYYAWADEIFGLVADRVAGIPEAERVTVLPIRSDITQVFGNNCIWGYVVEMAGGRNLSGDVTANTGKFFADVDAEQIVKWNPDMMFQINFNGEFTPEVAGIATGWATDQRFAGMKAFESKRVYLTPKGIDYWNAAIEAPLAVLWMAQIMYPDRFTDVDVKQKAAEFYKAFLGYDLTEADWALIAPQFEGFRPNGLTP